MPKAVLGAKADSFARSLAIEDNIYSPDPQAGAQTGAGSGGSVGGFAGEGGSCVSRDEQ